MNKFKLLFILSVVVFFSACKKSNKSSEDPIPSISYFDLTNTISNKTGIIIEAAFQLALSSKQKLDTKSIVDKVKLIAGVQDCYLLPEGHTLSVQQIDGKTSNYFLDSENDQNAYTLKINNIIQPVRENINQLKTNGGVYTYPNGKRAIILAPFQKEFHNNFRPVAIMLERFGYTVDSLKDSDVNLNYFRSEALKNYDIIILSTHGGFVSAKKNAPDETTLLTGEKVNDKTWNELTDAEKKVSYCASPDTGRNQYFAITPNFLNCNNNKSFGNAWIFLSACWGVKNNDFSDYFLQKGAIACNGFTASINTQFSTFVLAKMMSSMTNMNYLEESMSQVTDDPGLKAISWAYYLYDTAVDISLYKMVKTKNDRYLIVNTNYLQPYFDKNFSITSTTARLSTFIGGDVYDPKTIGLIRYKLNGSLEYSGNLYPAANVGQNYYTDVNIKGLGLPKIDVYFIDAFDNKNNIIAKGNTTFITL